MVRFGKSVVDAMQQAGAIEGIHEKAGGCSFRFFGRSANWIAVVGEHGVNAIRNCSDQRFEESRSSLHVSTLEQLHESELRNAINSHEEVELAFRGTHFGKIDGRSRSDNCQTSSFPAYRPPLQAPG